MTTPTPTKPAVPAAPASAAKPGTPVPPPAAGAAPAVGITPDGKIGLKPEGDAKSETKTDAKPAKPEMSVADIDGGFILTAELATVSAPVRARNDKQRAMDKKVKELHALWIKASKPSTWDAMVKGGAVATYFVEPDKSADLHKLITRAVSFHGLRSRMGTAFKVTEAHVAKFKLPAEYLGREAISFAILDKRPRATSDGKSASAIIADKQGAAQK